MLHTITKKKKKKIEICIDINIEISEGNHYKWIFTGGRLLGTQK